METWVKTREKVVMGTHEEVGSVVDEGVEEGGKERGIE